jgi:hypothetical protein
MESEVDNYWEFYRKYVVDLQSIFSRFKTELIDRESFKRFADNLQDEVGGWTEICITGYFSETTREQLERIINCGRKLRLISPELNVSNSRDKKNLGVLKKLCSKGAQVKVNSRLHARFLVAFHPDQKDVSGILLVGSFDFNTECIGKERYDVGIKTVHPDLIRSARKLFDEIWNEPESVSLDKKYP